MNHMLGIKGKREGIQMEKEAGKRGAVSLRDSDRGGGRGRGRGGGEETHTDETEDTRHRQRVLRESLGTLISSLQHSLLRRRTPRTMA